MNVIDLFKNINALPDEAKSSSVSLPTYQILNFDNDDDQFSIWQAVKGEQYQGFAADTIIQAMSRSTQRDGYHEKLQRLETVCRALNLSDLHPENLIFTDDEVIPIDLESIQLHHATGLYERPGSVPPLSARERELIETTQKSLRDIPYRFVPISTSSFIGGLTRCDSFIDLAKVVCEEVHRQGYALMVAKEELEWYILCDFIHNDVPYFTEYRSMIYFGFPNAGKPIARRL